MHISKLKSFIYQFCTKYFWLLVCLSVALRIFLVLVSPHIGDVKNYYLVGLRFTQTGKVYENNEGKNPYPPIWTYYEGLSVKIHKQTNIPFRYILKIPIVLADLGIIWILFKLLKDRVSVLWFALNPLVLFIGSAESGFDSIVIFFLLLAYKLFKKNLFWTGLFLAISIALKTYTVLLFPIFFMKITKFLNKIKFSLAVGIPLLLIMVPALVTEFDAIQTTYLSYSGNPDYGWVAIIKTLFALIYGTSINLSPFIQWQGFLLNISKFIFIGAYFWLVWSIYKYKVNLAKGVVLIFMLFYILMGGVATTYLSWVIPFLLIIGTPEIFSYTIITSIAMVCYLLSQLYKPVLMHTDFVFFQSPVLLNLFYLITLLLFWGYCIHLYLIMKSK